MAGMRCIEYWSKQQQRDRHPLTLLPDRRCISTLCVGYKAKIRGGESLEIGEILQEKITCLSISVPQ